MPTNGNTMTDVIGMSDAIDLEKSAAADGKSCTSIQSSSEDEKTDLDKAIRLTDFGWYHAVLILVSGCCLMVMVIEVMGISFILPAAQCDLALSTAQKGYLSGATFFGMVVSAHMWGFCADTFGRKKILLISIAGTWAFSFSSSFAPTAVIFIALRFFTGFFLCGNSSTVYAYLSEFLHSLNRSRIMTWTCGFMTLAYLLIPGLAWVLIPVKTNWVIGSIVFTSWRIYIVVLGIVSFSMIFAFTWFPESPKFLMSVGKEKEALNVLRKIYAINTRNPADKYPVKSLQFENNLSIPKSDDTVRKTKVPKLFEIIWRQTAPLFCKPYGWKTLLFCSIQFGLYFSSAGLYLWMPNFLNLMTSTGNNESSSDLKPSETICGFIAYEKSHRNSSQISEECSGEIRSEVYMSTLIVGVFYLLTYSSYGLLVSKFGNKIVAVVALFFGGIAVLALYFISNKIVITLLLSGCIVLTGTSISVLSAVIVDAYPTNLRALAVSLALTFGRFGSGVAGNVVGIFLESNCDYAIIGLGCIVIACSLLCTFLPKK